MICQQCQKRLANVQIVHHDNGKQSEIFLCSQCATHNENVMFKTVPGFMGGLQMNLHEFLPGFMGYVTGAVPQKETACALCKTTFSQFQKTGLLGCGHCYETFSNELAPVIARIQGNVEYKGKKPGQVFEEPQALSSLQSFRKELKEAIGREDYETAALIRDKIRELEASEEQKGVEE